MKTAVDAFTPAYRRQIAKMTAETEQLDRELDEQEARRRLQEAFDEQVTRFLRRAIPEQAPLP